MERFWILDEFYKPMKTYWISDCGSEPSGPYDLNVISRMLRDGRVSGEAHVCPVGESQWMSAQATVAEHRRGKIARAIGMTVIGVIILVGIVVVSKAMLDVNARERKFREWAGQTWEEMGLARPGAERR